MSSLAHLVGIELKRPAARHPFLLPVSTDKTSQSTDVLRHGMVVHVVPNDRLCPTFATHQLHVNLSLRPHARCASGAGRFFVLFFSQFTLAPAGVTL